MWRSVSQGLAAAIVAGAILIPGGASSARDAEVDLALVLALDCSASVDGREFAQQMQGLGLAFQRKDVQEAIHQGKLHRIAVSVVQWSGMGNQATVIPWTVIASGNDATRFGAVLSVTPRGLEPTATSISSALLYADSLLGQAPVAARQLIDVSADGPNNIGPSLAAARDRLVGEGIIINGLAIENEWRSLKAYMEDAVAGGEGHFVIRAGSYDDYADAIARKLVREITGPGIS